MPGGFSFCVLGNGMLVVAPERAKTKGGNRYGSQELPKSKQLLPLSLLTPDRDVTFRPFAEEQDGNEGRESAAATARVRFRGVFCAGSPRAEGQTQAQRDNPGYVDQDRLRARLVESGAMADGPGSISESRAAAGCRGALRGRRGRR